MQFPSGALGSGTPQSARGGGPTRRRRLTLLRLRWVIGGKMAAPEEPELSQAQTEKLLQFQVDTSNSPLTRVRVMPH